MITDTFRTSQQVVFLLELDFDGFKKRFSHKTVVVPSSGDDLQFDGMVLNTFNLGSRFNLYSGTYALQSVTVELANKDRFQDLEKCHRLESGTGKIWAWCEGLTFEDIETKALLFSGGFEKVGYDRFKYTFNLVDLMLAKSSLIPPVVITEKNWPLAPAFGKPEPWVFGSVRDGVPCVCVDEDNFIYLAAGQKVVSVDADYQARTETLLGNEHSLVHDEIAGFTTSDGSAVTKVNFFDTGLNIYVDDHLNGGKVTLDTGANAGLTRTISDFVSATGEVIVSSAWSKQVLTGTHYTIDHPLEFTMANGPDGAGNPCVTFTFEHAVTNQEPISCSIVGAIGRFEFSSDLGYIEHPADIVFNILVYDFENQIDIGMMQTMKNLLPGFKFATVINSQAFSIDIVNRLLAQVRCALIWNAGEVGPVTFDMNADPKLSIDTLTDTVGRIKISSTPPDKIVNRLTINYELCVSSGRYYRSFTLDETNDEKCKLSNFQYGLKKALSINLTDVGVEDTARACAQRYLDWFAFSHDLVEIHVPYFIGLNLLEGDAILLTASEGPGEWVDEKFLVLEKIYGPKTITLTLWRVETT